MTKKTMTFIRRVKTMRIKVEHRYFIRDAKGNTICQPRTEKQGLRIIKRNIKTFGDTLELLDMYGQTMTFAGGEDAARFSIARREVADQLAMWKTAELYDDMKKTVYNQTDGTNRNSYVIVFPDEPNFTRYAHSLEGARKRITKELEYAKRNVSERPEDRFFKKLVKRWESAQILTREEFEKSVEKESTEKCQ